MKWNDYSKLTEKQKEEYNFKFKDRIDFGVSGLSYNLSFLILGILTFMLVAYIITISPEMSQYKNDVFLIMKSLFAFVFASCIIFFGYIIDFLVRMIIRTYKYQKWLNENNIKVSKWFK